jgi:hypothetical protein
MTDMQTSPPRRLALLPVEERTDQDRPAIRRYKLARVIDATIAHEPTPAQGPATGVRSP